MKLSTLQKLGGIAIIIGAVLFTAYAVCRPIFLPVIGKTGDFSLIIASPNWIWISTLSLPGVLLMVFGFTAVYSRIYKNAGVIGLIGYLFIALAYILQGAQLTWEIFLYPIIAGHGPSLALFKDRIMLMHPLFQLYRILFDTTIGIGVILFSITLIRGKAFPKIAGILVLCGAFIYAAGPFLNTYVGILGVLILSAGCFILGTKLLSEAKG
jgi:hypothetical protein